MIVCKDHLCDMRHEGRVLQSLLDLLLKLPSLQHEFAGDAYKAGTKIVNDNEVQELFHVVLGDLDLVLDRLEISGSRADLLLH
jgi:hypothetical protein